MANLTEVYTGSLQVGAGAIPPVSSATFEQSLDPTRPFSIHNLGIHQGEGIQNQLGIYNGLGVWNELGIYNGIGQGIFVGGHTDAQPFYDSSALEINLNSPFGNLNDNWFYNGTPLDYLHNHSDVRLKKDIKPLGNCLNKILNLSGVSFTWDKNVTSYAGRGKQTDIGLIAQEVEKIIPEVVQETSIPNIDFPIKNVDYSRIVPLLIEAIKEQQTQIESLNGTVQKLSLKLESCCQSC